MRSVLTHINKITTGTACAVERDEDCRSIWGHPTVQTYDPWGLGSRQSECTTQIARAAGGHRPRFGRHTAFVSESCAIWKHFMRRISVFKSQWIQNSLENHETWHDVTTWHIYVEEFFSSILAQVLLQASYKTEFLSKKPRGSDREMCPPCGRKVITASFRLVFSSTGNMER